MDNPRLDMLQTVSADLLVALKRVTDYAQDCAAQNDERPACIETARATIDRAISILI